VKVKLERTVTDHLSHRRYSIYRREDDRFFVLGVPTNPWAATSENVYESVVDTFDEALALCEVAS
jgi:hypothetical protein